MKGSARNSPPKVEGFDYNIRTFARAEAAILGKNSARKALQRWSRSQENFDCEGHSPAMRGTQVDPDSRILSTLGVVASDLNESSSGEHGHPQMNGGRISPSVNAYSLVAAVRSSLSPEAWERYATPSPPVPPAPPSRWDSSSHTSTSKSSTESYSIPAFKPDSRAVERSNRASLLAAQDVPTHNSACASSAGALSMPAHRSDSSAAQGSNTASYATVADVPRPFVFQPMHVPTSSIMQPRSVLHVSGQGALDNAHDCQDLNLRLAHRTGRETHAHQASTLEMPPWRKAQVSHPASANAKAATAAPKASNVRSEPHRAVQLHSASAAAAAATSAAKAASCFSAAKAATALETASSWTALESADASRRAVGSLSSPKIPTRYRERAAWRSPPSPPPCPPAGGCAPLQPAALFESASKSEKESSPLTREAASNLQEEDGPVLKFRPAVSVFGGAMLERQSQSIADRSTSASANCSGNEDGSSRWDTSVHVAANRSASKDGAPRSAAQRPSPNELLVHVPVSHIASANSSLRIVTMQESPRNSRGLAFGADHTNGQVECRSTAQRGSPSGSMDARRAVAGVDSSQEHISSDFSSRTLAHAKRTLEANKELEEMVTSLKGRLTQSQHGNLELEMKVQQAHEANAMLQGEMSRVKNFCAHACARLLAPGTQDTEMLRAARGGSWENLKSFYADWLRSGGKFVVQSYGEEARVDVAKSQGIGVRDVKEVESRISRKRSPGRRGGGVRDVSVKNRVQGNSVYSEEANWKHRWGGVCAEMRNDKDDLSTSHHANDQKGVSAGTVRV